MACTATWWRFFIDQSANYYFNFCNIVFPQCLVHDKKTQLNVWLVVITFYILAVTIASIEKVDGNIAKVVTLLDFLKQIQMLMHAPKNNIV